MSEYIKKEVAVELLKEIKRRVPDDMETCVQATIDAINAIPAADVEPVVRCKDCRSFNVCLVRQLANIADDGFCSLGDGALAEKGDADGK